MCLSLFLTVTTPTHPPMYCAYGCPTALGACLHGAEELLEAAAIAGLALVVQLAEQAGGPLVQQARQVAVHLAPPPHLQCNVISQWPLASVTVRSGQAWAWCGAESENGWSEQAGSQLDRGKRAPGRRATVLG